jgi:hypothetical protein
MGTDVGPPLRGFRARELGVAGIYTSFPLPAEPIHGCARVAEEAALGLGGGR